jgi:hypothetical protein
VQRSAAQCSPALWSELLFCAAVYATVCSQASSEGDTGCRTSATKSSCALQDERLARVIKVHDAGENIWLQDFPLPEEGREHRAVQSNAVQCSAVQCSAVQCSAVWSVYNAERTAGRASVCQVNPSTRLNPSTKCSFLRARAAGRGGRRKRRKGGGN